MLPKNKFDINAIEKMALIPLDELNPKIPQLLEWLQDGNWPVAPPMAKLLINTGEALIPHLAMVLQGSDTLWKYWCIELLIKRLPPNLVYDLSIELKSLSNNPSQEEIAEEVNIVATEALSLCKDFPSNFNEIGY